MRNIRLGFNTTQNLSPYNRTTNSVSLGKVRTGQYQTICDYDGGNIYTSSDFGYN